jgi:hypothetical protein
MKLLTLVALSLALTFGIAVTAVATHQPTAAACEHDC